jgi:Fic family protein
MNLKLKILPTEQLPFKAYKEALSLDMNDALAALEGNGFTADNFKFYTSVSVISSSKIEGESLDVDSYVRHKMQDIEYLPNLTEKPNDLFEAYTFAQRNKLSKQNFLQAHKLLTQHLLPEKQRGVCRKNEMLVMEHNTGRIQYEAAPASVVESEFDKLWLDIDLIIEAKLTVEEVFYYASLIHLVFVNIHPFNDGNGRAARLVEKWFLTDRLGDKAWFIQSEKYYYKNVDAYYKNLARLGMFYERLDYSKAMPFMMMLPVALA